MVETWPRAWWRTVPSSCLPVIRMPPTSHRFECPVAQGAHFPQAGRNPAPRGRPGRGRSPRDPPPPPPRRPRGHRSREGTGMSPVSRCSSEWHMPDAANLMRTSPCLGGVELDGLNAPGLDGPTEQQLRFARCPSHYRSRRDCSRYRGMCLAVAEGSARDSPPGARRGGRNDAVDGTTGWVVTDLDGTLWLGDGGCPRQRGGDPRLRAGRSRSSPPRPAGHGRRRTSCEGRTGPPGRAPQRCARSGQGR